MVCPLSRSCHSGFLEIPLLYSSMSYLYRDQNKKPYGISPKKRTCINERTTNFLTFTLCNWANTKYVSMKLSGHNAKVLRIWSCVVHWNWTRLRAHYLPPYWNRSYSVQHIYSMIYSISLLYQLALPHTSILCMCLVSRTAFAHNSASNFLWAWTSKKLYSIYVNWTSPTNGRHNRMISKLWLCYGIYFRWAQKNGR